MPDHAPARTRPVVAAIGAALACIGAFLLPFVISAALGPTSDTTAGINAFAGVIVVGLGGVGPLALGLWLLYIGAPTLPAKLRASLASAGTRAFWRRVGTKLASSPLGRAALAFAAAGIGAMLLPARSGWFAVFVVLMIYSVADPAINALRPRWWIATAQSVVGWFVLFMMGGAFSEADRLGESAMVFLAPVMLYPIALGISGLIRLVRWSSGRVPAASR
jgi:hypothetical protein